MEVVAKQTEKNDWEFWKAVPRAGEGKVVVGSWPPLSSNSAQLFSLFWGREDQPFSVFSNSSRGELPFFSVTYLIHSYWFGGGIMDFVFRLLH